MKKRLLLIPAVFLAGIGAAFSLAASSPTTQTVTVTDPNVTVTVPGITHTITLSISKAKPSAQTLTVTDPPQTVTVPGVTHVVTVTVPTVTETVTQTVTAPATTAASPPPAPPPPSAALLSDGFNAPNGTGGLITNAYAFWNYPAGVQSPVWEMTAGSVFSAVPPVAQSGNAGWTGVPDQGCGSSVQFSTPTYCNESAVFRLNAKRHDFGNVRVDVDLYQVGLVSTSRTPAVAWDGVHIWLHYQSEYELYYASVNRRDGHVVIKKKCLGGTTNGGTYYTLADKAGYAIPFGVWQRVGASIVDNPDGSVTIGLFREGVLVLSATDTGTGCAPIVTVGSVGVRGDNANFYLDNLTVEAS